MAVVMAFEAVVARQVGRAAVAVEEGCDLFVAGTERVVVAEGAYNGEAVAPLLALVDRHPIQPQHVPIQAQFEALVPEAMDLFPPVNRPGGFDTTDRVDLYRKIDGRPLDGLAVAGGKMLA